MTNAPKPEQDLTHNEHSFDGITFEVVEKKKIIRKDKK